MNTPESEQPYIEELENKMVQGRKGGIVFWALFFSACVVAGCAHFFYQHRYVPLIQLSIVLLLGCIYAALMRKRLAGKEAFSHALLLSIGLVIVLSAVYFLKKSFQFLDVFSLASAFFLPNMVTEAWRLFHSISSQYKPLWSYSEEIPSEPVFVYLENKPLRVKLLVGDNDPLMISSVAPLTLPLGMAMFYLLKKEVEVNSADWRKFFINENGQAYKWLFYNKSYGLVKTYFKPDETLHENKIRSNELIIAKRIG